MELWQRGHSGLSRPSTRASNSSSHFLQRYSNIGINRVLVSLNSNQTKVARIRPRGTAGKAARSGCHLSAANGFEPHETNEVEWLFIELLQEQNSRDGA